MKKLGDFGALIKSVYGKFKQWIYSHRESAIKCAGKLIISAATLIIEKLFEDSIGEAISNLVFSFFKNLF